MRYLLIMVMALFAFPVCAGKVVNMDKRPYELQVKSVGDGDQFVRTIKGGEHWYYHGPTMFISIDGQPFQRVRGDEIWGIWNGELIIQRRDLYPDF